jgi:flagellar motor switch protein FliN/FliY
MAGALSTAQSERWGRRISFQPQVGEGVPVLGGVFYPLSLEIQGMDPRSITLCIDPELQATLKVLDNQRQELSDFPHSDDFQEGMASDSSFPGAQPSAPAGRFSRMSADPGAPAAPVAPVMSMPPPPATPQQVMIDSKDPSVQRLLDVPIEVTIELGQTELSIRRILEIGPGSIIELDRMAGEPVDLVVNDKVIAHGEVVVIEENFGIRITQLVTPDQRNRPSR